MPMGSKIGGIVVGVVVIAVLRGVFSPSLNQQIINECEKINKECPKMTDEVTRLDKATPGDMQLTLDYTLIKVELNAEQLNQLETLISGNVKSDKGLKQMLDKDIKLTFHFHNEAGVMTKQFDVTK
jgi:hypothetical protein